VRLKKSQTERSYFLLYYIIYPLFCQKLYAFTTFGAFEMGLMIKKQNTEKEQVVQERSAVFFYCTTKANQLIFG